MDLLLIVRGLTAIAVVFWHGFGAYHVNEISSLINIPRRTAVWIFFGISGYVISYGFIHKKYSFSFNSLKNFYTNRLLRIYPLFICILISISLLIASNFLYHKNQAIFWSSDGVLLIDTLILMLIMAHGSIAQGTPKNKTYLICAFLGTLSYGIYAWHPLLMRFIDNIQVQPFYISISILILLITIVIATISFKVIEIPALKLRRY